MPSVAGEQRPAPRASHAAPCHVPRVLRGTWQLLGRGSQGSGGALLWNNSSRTTTNNSITSRAGLARCVMTTTSCDACMNMSSMHDRDSGSNRDPDEQVQLHGRTITVTVHNETSLVEGLLPLGNLTGHNHESSRPAAVITSHHIACLMPSVAARGIHFIHYFSVM